MMNNDNDETRTSRRSLAFGLLTAVGGAAFLKGCASDSSSPGVPGGWATPDSLESVASALSTTSGIGVSVHWCDSYAELRNLVGGASSSSQNVAILRGSAASSPATGIGGVFTWSSDTTTPDDGGTLIAAASSRTGCWNRSYSGPLNVLWFGATGNGTTNDTSAFQNAISAAVASTKSLYVPQGVYKLSPGITVDGDLAILGAGPNASVLDFGNDSATPGITVSYAASVIRYFSMHGLELSGGGVQLYLNPWIWKRDGVLDGVEFSNFHRKGLHVATEAVSVQLKNLNFVAGSAASGQQTYGLYAEGGAVLHYAILDSIRATQCTGAGIWIGNTGAAGSGGSMGTLLRGLVCEANPGSGIYIKSAGIILHDAFFENNGSAAGVADIQIDTNYASGSVTYSRVDLYSPTFADSTSGQQLSAGKHKRIEFLNQGVKLSCHNAYVAASYPSFIAANSFATNTIHRVLSDLEVRTNYGQLAMRQEAGHIALGAFACEGSTPAVTSVSVDGGTYGGGAIVIATGHVGSTSPITTRTGVYMLTYRYDGSNGTFAPALIAGTDFVTFSVSSGCLAFKPTDGTNAAISVLAGKSA